MNATNPPASDADGSADEASVQQTLAGDPRAFEALVARYQRRVVSLAYRLLGNAHDAAEVGQEAFVRAFRSLAGLQEPRRFGPWLLRITGNLALNFRRGRRVGLSLSGDDDGQPVLEEHGAGASLAEWSHDALVSEETRTAVEAAIARLPEKQRMCLILFAIEGLPHKEVAEILECGVEAVKWNVFQARKRLKDELAEFLEE